MSFYKQLVFVAIIVLIISLAFIGTVLSSSSKDSKFPPSIAACPDFYMKNDDGKCEASKKVYNSNGENSTGENSTGENSTGADCAEIDFTEDQYLAQGTGPNSGACAKKKKAQACGITWDGLTNNEDICYVKN